MLKHQKNVLTQSEQGDKHETNLHLRPMQTQNSDNHYTLSTLRRKPTMTKDQALKLALTALEINQTLLEKITPYKGQEDLLSDSIDITQNTIIAIKEALANVVTNDTPKERVDEIQKQRHEANVQKFLGAPQPEQEPVAHTLNCVCGAVWDIKADGSEEMVHIPDITPPQRTWVGLTDEEISKVLGSDIHDEPSGELRFIRAIEAKLKQKNGYAEEKNT